MLSWDQSLKGKLIVFCAYCRLREVVGGDTFDAHSRRCASNAQRQKLVAAADRLDQANEVTARGGDAVC